MNPTSRGDQPRQFDSMQGKRCLRHSNSRLFRRPNHPQRSSNLPRARTDSTKCNLSVNVALVSLFFRVEDGGGGEVTKWLVMRPLGAGAGINTFWRNDHSKNSSLKESVKHQVVEEIFIRLFCCK